MTRAEKVGRAQELRARGLKLREIAAEMGSTRSTVSAYLSDPDLKKQKGRRYKYAGRCVDCGAPTDGSRGPGKASTRCQPCATAHQHAMAHWTRDRIVRAIQAFNAIHGRPPYAPEWLSGVSPEYPCVTTVQLVFGRWSDAIRAAGFDPVAVGHHGGDRRPGEDMALCRQLRNRYYAGESSVALARELGCSQAAVAYRIRKAGGVMRSNEEAQRLRRAA